MKKRPFMQSIHILLPILLSLAFNAALSMIAMALIALIAPSDPKLTSYYINNSRQMAVYINAVITFIIGIIFFLMYTKESEDRRISFDLFLPVYILLGLSLSLFLNMFFDFAHLTNASESYKNIASIQYSVPLIAGILIYGIIKPIEEELLYRGLFYGRLRKIFPAYLSIPVSSVIFGLMHGNLTQFVYASLMGLLLSFVMEKQKNLIPCIIIHALANMVIFSVSSIEILHKYVFTIPGCIISGLVSLFAILFICAKMFLKGKLKPLKAGEPTAETSSKEDGPL